MHVRSIYRVIILLLALVCAVQAASAFTITTETVSPASGALEPGQQVTAHYKIAYSMTTTGSSQGNDESFDFSTGLQNPVWTFTIYRDGVAINTVTKGGFYPTLTEFELDYGGDVELDVQLRGRHHPPQRELSRSSRSSIWQMDGSSTITSSPATF